jgi:hypothetical protein
MWRNLHKNEGKMERTTVVNPMSGPVWKVCIARRISLVRNFDAFYIFSYLLLNFRNLWRAISKLSSLVSGSTLLLMSKIVWR